MAARRVIRLAAGSVVASLWLLVVAGCGSAEDELTVKQQLEKLSGHTLSSTEVEERLALADTMCGFDDRVLAEIWDELDARELEFQDWVFGQHCPNRLPDYEAARPDTGNVDPAILRTTTTTMDPALLAEAADLLESVGTTTPSADGEGQPANSRATSTTR